MGTVLLLLIFVLCSSVAFDENDFIDKIKSYFPSKNINVSSNYVFIGDTLNVTCNMTDKRMEEGLSSADITFALFDAVTNHHVCFQSTDVNVVDNKTAVLTTTVYSNSTGVYECVLKDPKCEGTGETLLAQTEDQVFVEYRPKPVEKFSCIVINWNDKIVCHWAFPVTYINTTNVNVSVEIVNPVRPHLSTKMINMTSCEWIDFVLPARLYKVLITVMNTRVTSARVSQYFNIDATKIVKPDSVQKFAVETSPGCFNLTWSRPSFTAISRIKMVIPGDALEQSEIVAENLTTFVFEKCNFKANVLRRFCIQTFPSGLLSGGYWSDPVCKEGTTPIEAPTGGPEISPGIHTTGRESCETNNKRNVTLFWKPLAMFKRNGDFGGYKITFKDHEKTIHEDKFSTTLELPCYEEIVVDIYAFNSAGATLSPSQLHIAPFQSEVPYSDIYNSFEASVSHQEVRVSWNQQSPAYKKYIFWCKGNFINNKCQDQLYWLEVQGNSMTRVLPINSPDASSYLYGIYRQENASSQSTDIFWTSCLIMDTGKIYTPYDINLASTGDGIQITWFSRKCSYEINYKVIGHTIKWCLNEKCEEQYVKHPLTSYTISDVKPGQTYNVTLRAETPSKKSMFMQWKNITLEEQVESHLDVIITSNVLFLIILGSCIYIRRRKQVYVNWIFIPEDWEEFLKLPDYMMPSEEVTPNQDNYEDYIVRMEDHAAEESLLSKSPTMQSLVLSTDESVSPSFGDNSAAILIPKKKSNKGKGNVNLLPLKCLTHNEMPLSSGTEDANEIFSNNTQMSMHSFSGNEDCSMGKQHIVSFRNSSSNSDQVTEHDMSSCNSGSSQSKSEDSNFKYMQFSESPSNMPFNPSWSRNQEPEGTNFQNPSFKYSKGSDLYIKPSDSTANRNPTLFEPAVLQAYIQNEVDPICKNHSSNVPLNCESRNADAETNVAVLKLEPSEVDHNHQHQDSETRSNATVNVNDMFPIQKMNQSKLNRNDARAIGNDHEYYKWSSTDMTNGSQNVHLSYNDSEC